MVLEDLSYTVARQDIPVLPLEELDEEDTPLALADKGHVEQH
jgi:hypothetical protein